MDFESMCFPVKPPLATIAQATRTERLSLQLRKAAVTSGRITTGSRWRCLEAVVEIPGGMGEVEVTIEYTYDPLYRLTAADYDDGTFFNYTYGAVGA